jgi:EAL domain-containing protein (putative c-di-GMP-specific phosphodiesterase class I)
VPRSIGIAHIVRQADGTATGVWGVHALKSAFQPIFAFDGGGKLSVAAFEGLIRPFRDGEPWAPGAFFSSIDPADRLHVETLTRTLHILNAAACLPADKQVFINFNPAYFVEHAVSETALREMRLVLHEAGIDPGRIVCEVTEQPSGSQETLFDFLLTLKANGFRIAVDDYGAEDSDIFRIRELKPDIVKFDARWIARLMESGPGLALLTTMVKAFEEQSIRTVFEGIEEPEQIELAELAGVSMLQGYALARPQIVPADFSLYAGGSTPDVAGPLPEEVRREAAASGFAGAARRPVRSFGRRIAR